MAEINRLIHVDNQIQGAKFWMKIVTEESILEFEELKTMNYRIRTTKPLEIHFRLELGFQTYLYQINPEADLQQITLLIILNQGKPVIYLNDVQILPFDSETRIFWHLLELLQNLKLPCFKARESEN